MINHTIHRCPTITVGTRLGQVAVSSPYLYDRQTSTSGRPALDHFGLEGGGKTLEFEAVLADLGSMMSFGAAEDALERLFGYSVGRTSILRTTRPVATDARLYLSERFETMIDSYGRSDQTRPEPDELMAHLDGCLIRTVEHKTAAQAGLAGQDGYQADDIVRDIEWREVSTGLVRALDEVDAMYACRLGP